MTKSDFYRTKKNTSQVLKGHFCGTCHESEVVTVKITLSAGDSPERICFSERGLLLCFSSWQCYGFNCTHTK